MRRAEFIVICGFFLALFLFMLMILFMYLNNELGFWISTISGTLTVILSMEYGWRYDV